MSRKNDPDRSVGQRVVNRARERRIGRDDAFIAYAMDRLLFRLGRSPQAGEFILKGGVLVANLVDEPFRFTRDIDVLRRHGPADADDLRDRFRQIAAVVVDDGALFPPDGVRTLPAEHDEDGYDGVKVYVRALVGSHPVEVRIDIGFGDALVPPATRISLGPFLSGDEPARVLAYAPPPVLAEKIEAVISKFPAIRHRLKDILDIVVVVGILEIDGTTMLESLRATMERRGTSADAKTLDDMRAVLMGRRWRTDWATMFRDKAVTKPLNRMDAVALFDRFVRPLLTPLAEGQSLGGWKPDMGWQPPSREVP